MLGGTGYGPGCAVACVAGPAQSHGHFLQFGFALAGDKGAEGITCSLLDLFFGIASRAAARSSAFFLADTVSMSLGRSSSVRTSCRALSLLFLEPPSLAANSDISSNVVQTVSHNARCSLWACFLLSRLRGGSSRYRRQSSWLSEKK